MDPGDPLDRLQARDDLDGQPEPLVLGRVAGVLAGALNEPEALEALVEASELVREKRLKRIEHGVWD